MSASMDKIQRRIMMFIPLIFITVIAHFPTGLVIYWVTTNLWTVGQGLVTRRLVPKTAPAAAGPKRSSRAPATTAAVSNGAPATPAPKPKPQNQTPAQPRRVKRNKGRGRR
jgi:YidC/Oxa1 family membrane protein insertase